MEFSILTREDMEIIVPAEEVLPFMVDGWAFACNYSADGAVLTGQGWQIWHKGNLIPIDDAIAAGICVQMGPDERINEERNLNDGELFEAIGDSDPDADGD